MKRVAAFLLAWMCAATALVACPVPVFRYALENWEPDRYKVDVLHRGGMSAETQASANLLVGHVNNLDATVNLTVRFVDLGEATEPRAASPDDGRGSDVASLVVYAPGGTGGRKPVWRAALTRETVSQLVDSPARREVVRRLLDGDSAVWILLESGDRCTDDAAATRLQKLLDVMQASLVLPDDPTGLASGPPLRLAFSMLRLKRDDPAEAFFVASLLRLDGNEPGTGRPVAFPVFGRGRVLPGLAGGDIDERNVRTACRFLVGPCSCEAKALNPGADLLMAADWDAELGGNVLQVLDLPPLVGLSALAETAGPSEDSARPAQAAEPAAEVLPAVAEAEAAPGLWSGRLMRNMIFALGAILAIVGFLVVRVLRGTPGGRS